MTSRTMPVWGALAICSALAVTACGASKPSGQVVAKVGKEEITALDLQTELGGYKAPNAQARKAAEQAALQAIIQRKELAQAAREQKLDRTPEYARLKTREDELLLVKLWQERLARAVPAPNMDEIQQYVDAHPDSFAARKIISFDAIRFVATDPSLPAQLKPLTTLEQVKALLEAHKVPFQATNGQVDGAAANPQVVAQLLKVGNSDIFAMQEGGVWTVGKVNAVKVDPLTGQAAIARATDILRGQRMNEAVGRGFGAAVEKAKKDVQYNDAYQPKPAKKAQPAAGKS